ncbi:MAG: DUF4250 domain-containing protein [Bacteroidaceae bacterium]|nr:DUF4250 domain-containing protein [Bacteroidaceae bacterium]
MDYLPQDPFILASCINMLLRDNEFDTLNSLCCYFNKDINELTDYLNQNGFEYIEEQKQFR